MKWKGEARAVALVAVALLASVGLAGPAGAVGNELAVSVPSEAVSVRAGGSAGAVLRIVNRGAEPLSVNISLRRITLGDDGRASVTDEADPVWASRVTIDLPSATVAPNSYVDDHVSFAVPADTAPDTYLVGFLVEPVVAAGSVRVVNRIGSFIALDVPGPRNRALRIASMGAPRVVLGSGFTSTVVLENSGPSFVTTWGEVHAAPTVGAERATTFDQARFRIAPTHSRSLSFPARFAFPLGPVQVRTTFFFNQTDQTVVAVQASRTVWMLHPVYPAAAALGAMAGAWALLHRRRRRVVAPPTSPPAAGSPTTNTKELCRP